MAQHLGRPRQIVQGGYERGDNNNNKRIKNQR